MLKAKLRKEEIEHARFNLILTAVTTDTKSQQGVNSLNDLITSYNKIITTGTKASKEDFVDKASKIFKDFTSKNPQFNAGKSKNTYKPRLPNQALKDIL